MGHVKGITSHGSSKNICTSLGVNKKECNTVYIQLYPSIRGRKRYKNGLSVWNEPECGQWHCLSGTQEGHISTFTLHKSAEWFRITCEFWRRAANRVCQDKGCFNGSMSCHLIPTEIGQLIKSKWTSYWLVKCVVAHYKHVVNWTTRHCFLFFSLA